VVDYVNVKLVDELVVIFLFTFNFCVRCKMLTLQKLTLQAFQNVDAFKS
jgi:hypothetical protein